jgi:hypothetical protein
MPCGRRATIRGPGCRFRATAWKVLYRGRCFAPLGACLYFVVLTFQYRESYPIATQLSDLTIRGFTGPREKNRSPAKLDPENATMVAAGPAAPEGTFTSDGITSSAGPFCWDTQRAEALTLLLSPAGLARRSAQGS